MKITRIRICQTGLPYVDGAYGRGAGNAIETATAALARLVAPSLPGEAPRQVGRMERLRDHLIKNRIPVVSADIWGGEIAPAAHFAASTPSEFLQNATDLTNTSTRSAGIGRPVSRNGKLYAPDTAGMGVVPDFESLGAPIQEFRP